MDIDVLIAAVFKRTPISDKRHKLHSNQNAVDRYCKEIRKEMNYDGKYYNVYLVSINNIIIWYGSMPWTEIITYYF